MRRCAGLLVLLVLAGCAPGTSGPTSTPSSAAVPEGKFVAVYEPAGEETRPEEQLLRDGKVLEDFVDGMNAYVKIPRDVRVVALDCGEANAFYLPDEHEINLCYELSAAERELFAAAGATGTELDDEVYNSAVGTLYHEAGHALIGELDLKITGREEDVADQLAAYVLTSDEAFTDILLTVSYSYQLSAEQAKGLEDLPFYDTHSLDEQRSINFLCYLYGSDAERFETLVTDGHLPQERAESCPEEYQQLVDGWEHLLEPHLR